MGTRAHPVKAKPPENVKNKKAVSRQPSSQRATVEDESEDEIDEPAIDLSKAKFGPPRKAVRISNPEITKEIASHPELPYAFVPPTQEVVRPKTSVPPESEPIPLTGKKGAAYRTVAPVEKPEAVTDLLEDILTAPFATTIGDLLAASPDLRKKFAKVTTGKRVPVATTAERNTFVNQLQSFHYAIEDEFENVELPEHLKGALRARDLPRTTFTQALETDRELPEGAIVHNDPVVQYLDALPPGEESKPIVFPAFKTPARESETLRVLYPKINGKLEEVILDSGSQIVSMSKEVAVGLGIAWDPRLKINMQSANNTFDQTHGIARNVPFEFAHGVTIHMQLHILDTGAYRVLLGRPFDAIGQTVINNFKDGSQTVTVTDPNTGTKVSMPTHPRGLWPHEDKAAPWSKPSVEDYFRNSMN